MEKYTVAEYKKNLKIEHEETLKIQQEKDIFKRKVKKEKREKFLEGIAFIKK